MLVSCPSCGKRISDRAPACPFCKTANPNPPPAKSAAAAADPPVNAPPPVDVTARQPEPEAITPAPQLEPPKDIPAPEPDPPAAVAEEEPDPSMTVPYEDPAPEVIAPAVIAPAVVAPEVAAPAPPPPPAPRVPFPPSDDPTATLPPSPALFFRHSIGVPPPPPPPVPQPAPAPVEAAPVPTPPPPEPVPAAPVPAREEPPTAPKAGVVADPDAVILEATEHLNAGRFDDALTTIDRVLGTQSRNGDALSIRAQALFKVGKRDNAAREIVKAIEASPDSLAFWLTKATMEHEEDKPKDACRSAMDLVEIAQHTGTESALVDQGRQMIADFEATGAFPSARGHLGWLGLGCVSMKAGRPEAALDFFDRAINAASSNPDGFRWKGKALMQLDQVDEAFSLFDAALEVAPNDAEVHYDRGMAFAILGDLERAIEAFDAALAIDPHHTAALKEKRDLAD